ncbi:VOC family protein [bacterium]|nr:VOC family protein [bacterium]
MESTWKLVHVGIPVRDLDKAIEDYKSLGVASFKPEYLIDSSNFGEYLVYGKTPDPAVKTRVAIGEVGPLGIELLQPVQGKTVHREFLESVGTGIGHIAYAVEDLEAEIAKLVEKGFPVILSFTSKGEERRRGVYIDTRSKFSNLIIELIQAR